MELEQEVHEGCRDVEWLEYKTKTEPRSSISNKGHCWKGGKIARGQELYASGENEWGHTKTEEYINYNSIAKRQQ